MNPILDKWMHHKDASDGDMRQFMNDIMQGQVDDSVARFTEGAQQSLLMEVKLVASARAVAEHEGEAVMQLGIAAAA